MTGRVGSLCSGYGGLDLAVESLVGVRTVWHAEVDPHASTVLAHRWPGVPNLGDLTVVDWPAVEPVDVLTAGYPCQPFSTAGRRQGEDDPRHLWPHVLRAVRALRPRLVLLENVAGHLSLGFGRVLADLAASGYVGSWRCVRASDVGACHRRERVFIAAHPDGETWRRHEPRRGPRKVQGPEVDGRAEVEPRRRDGSDRGTQSVAANPDGSGPQGAQPAARCHLSYGSAAADADVGRREGRPELDGQEVDAERVGMQRHAHRRRMEMGGPFGVYQPAVDRWAAVVGRPAPAGLAGRRLNPRFVEWMMGLADGWVTDLVPRRHALRILGNGVVPQQALAAYAELLSDWVRP